jgi:hypothetical protein
MWVETCAGNLVNLDHAERVYLEARGEQPGVPMTWRLCAYMREYGEVEIECDYEGTYAAERREAIRAALLRSDGVVLRPKEAKE